MIPYQRRCKVSPTQWTATVIPDGQGRELKSRIEQRAYEIWQQETGDQKSPEWYWNQAQNEIVNPIILALIADIDDIVFKSDIMMEYWRHSDNHKLAYVDIDRDVLTIYSCDLQTENRYDLNAEADIEKCIEHLKLLMSYSSLIDKTLVQPAITHNNTPRKLISVKPITPPDSIIIDNKYHWHKK